MGMAVALCSPGLLHLLLALLSLHTQAQQGSAFGFSAPSKWKPERLADFRVQGSCRALPPRPRYLLEDFCRRLVRAVEYHIELLALLHLLQQRPGILVPRGQLADFDFNVVSGRGFDELLQAN